MAPLVPTGIIHCPCQHPPKDPAVRYYSSVFLPPYQQLHLPFLAYLPRHNPCYDFRIPFIHVGLTNDSMVSTDSGPSRVLHPTWHLKGQRGSFTVLVSIRLKSLLPTFAIKVSLDYTNICTCLSLRTKQHAKAITAPGT